MFAIRSLPRHANESIFTFLFFSIFFIPINIFGYIHGPDTALHLHWGVWCPQSGVLSQRILISDFHGVCSPNFDMYFFSPTLPPSNLSISKRFLRDARSADIHVPAFWRACSEHRKKAGSSPLILSVSAMEICSTFLVATAGAHVWLSLNQTRLLLEYV